MPRTKSRVREDYASLEKAWIEGGEIAVTSQAVRKYAQVIDVTESGRDMKPLISGMFEAIDRLKSLEAAAGATGETELARILAEANETLEQAALTNA